MNGHRNHGFLDIREAAEFLNISEKELMRLVEERRVPHSEFPGGERRFWPDRLRDWGLSYEQMPKYSGEGGPDAGTANIPMILELCKRFGYATRASSKWDNLCWGQKVFAQLHPRRDRDGVDLALRECENDGDLPECSALKKIRIRELNGYWRTNKGWLDGTRFTNGPAVAFHVPGVLWEGADAEGWKELESLLEHARKKLEKS